MARSIRRSGSTSVCIINTASARTPAQGNYFYNRETGQAERAATQYEYPQGSACFIQSVDDTMEDIMRLAMSEAMLFKYGSGTGTDLSSLRSHAGKTERRRQAERAAFVPEGLRPGRERGEERRQNPARGEDEHAQGLASGHRGIHRREAEGREESLGADRAGLRRQLQRRRLRLGHVSERKSERARERRIHGRRGRRPRMVDAARDATASRARRRTRATLLRKIAEGTYICGDPGMQFDTTIHKWHTCKGTDRQNSTNPCSEYLFLDNTACNLASLNLMKFKGEDGVFDVERFKAAVRIFITAQEIIVDNASYPIKEIAENSHIFRTLGLGYANLGSLIMSYGYGYDSDEGRALCRRDHRDHDRPSLRAERARWRGRWGRSRAIATRVAAACRSRSRRTTSRRCSEVIELHRSRVERDPGERRVRLSERGSARKVWDSALELGKKHGYRNAQVTVLAPTGTISFLMDCDTTGIEPDIALVKYKLLAGGGMLKIVNQTVHAGAAKSSATIPRRSSASSRTSTSSTRSKTWRIPTARRFRPG